MWEILAFAVIGLFLLAGLIIGLYSYFTFQPAVKRTQITTNAVIGGTESIKIDFHRPNGPPHSTVVRKLTGNNGKTWVLLHNSPFDFQVWFPLYMYAQSRAKAGEPIPTLVSFDILGHGTAWVSVPNQYNDTNPANVAWPVDDYSEEISAIYTALGINQATVVGYGFGGVLGLQFAIHYPKLVSELFILSIPISPTPGMSDEIRFLADWIAQNRDVSYLTPSQPFVEAGMCDWFDCSAPMTVERQLATRMMRESSATTLLQTDKLLTANDLRPQLKSKAIACPVTFLACNNDVYTPLDLVKADFQTYIRPAAPRATMYIVNGRHGFVLENPRYIYELTNGLDMARDPLTAQRL
jgi:pimeloyl-ACP methyl ester carboxylesterase